MLGKLGKKTDLHGNSIGKGRGRDRGRGRGRGSRPPCVQMCRGLKVTEKAKKVVAVPKKVLAAKKPGKLYYPGVPKKPMEVQHFGKFRIYTALNQNSWRAPPTERLRGIPLRSARYLKKYSIAITIFCFKERCMMLYCLQNQVLEKSVSHTYIHNLI